jgi:hypothetical protein
VNGEFLENNFKKAALKLLKHDLGSASLLILKENGLSSVNLQIFICQPDGVQNTD